MESRGPAREVHTDRGSAFPRRWVPMGMAARPVSPTGTVSQSADASGSSGRPSGPDQGSDCREGPPRGGDPSHLEANASAPHPADRRGYRHDQCRAPAPRRPGPRVKAARGDIVPAAPVPVSSPRSVMASEPPEPGRASEKQIATLAPITQQWRQDKPRRVQGGRTWVRAVSTACTCRQPLQP